MLQDNDTTMGQHIFNDENEYLENGNKIIKPFIITPKTQMLKINLKKGVKGL